MPLKELVKMTEEGLKLNKMDNELYPPDAPCVPDSPAYNLWKMAQQLADSISTGKDTDASASKYIEDRCKTDKDKQYAKWALGKCKSTT